MLYAEFPFGKHKGKTLDQVPADYCRWVLDNVIELDPDLETAIRASLRKRGGGFGGQSQKSNNSRRGGSSYSVPPSALPVAVDADIAAEIVKEGRRALAMRYHPDRGGNNELMVKVNASADFLETRLRVLLGMGGTL